MAMGFGLPGQKEWKGIVLYCLREGKIDDDLKKLKAYNERGCPVFLFGTAEMLAQAKAGGAQVESTVTIPAAPHDGLFQNADGTWVVQPYELGAFCAEWTWTAEFVSACSRRGKMPVMFQSIMVPTGMARIKKYQLKKFTTGQFQKFHEGKPQAVEAGKLGQQWIAMARKRLSAIHDTQMDKIHQAAQLAVQARQGGHQTVCIINGHGMVSLPANPHDPGYFRKIGGAYAARFNPKAKPADKLELHEGDFVLGIGYDSVFNDEANHHFADYVRQQKASAAWIAVAYKPEQVVLGPGEIRIDPQWELGDADVAFPGYDIQILPTSGVLVGSVYLMIEAEMHQTLGATTQAGH
jgi:hypothetical protein